MRTRLIELAENLRAAVQRLTFGPPVANVYNPLEYAWEAHRAYLTAYGSNRKRVLFLGMNPGPFGMAQTGVPFGDAQSVRNWLGIARGVGKPAVEHHKRPIHGFDCPRCEVSGRRLWGLFARRFGSADAFFAVHFVANYCPLVFLEASGCNRTPNKLPAAELGPLRAACDAHLRGVIDVLRPEWLIGIGRFAESRAHAVCGDQSIKIGAILHPSPASPASNRDWSGSVTRELEALGVWQRAGGSTGPSAVGER